MINVPHTAPSRCIKLGATYLRRHRDGERRLVRGPTRERYLRQDIACQSALCRTCRHKTTQSRLLSSSASHYVLLSTQALLRFYELFSSLKHFSDIIICRSSLNNIRSPFLIRQIRSFIQSTGRRVIVFENEYCLSSYRPQRLGEANDLYDRRVTHAAAKYLYRHWNQRMNVVLIDAQPASIEHADDVQDVESFLEYGATIQSIPKSQISTCGIQVHSMRTYLDVYHPNARDLSVLLQSITEVERARLKEEQTRIALAQSQSITNNQTLSSSTSLSTLYPEHLDEEALRAGVKSGLFLSGHLKVHRHHSTIHAFVDLGGRLMNRSTGVLTEADSEQSSDQVVGQVLIFGWLNRNRTVDGDEVVCEMLPRSQWKSTKQAIEETGDRVAEADPEMESPDSNNQLHNPDVVPSARVVGVLARHWRPYVGTLQLNQSGSTDTRALVVPMDSRVPKIRIVTRQQAQLSLVRLVVRIDEWPATDRYPTGHYVRSVGPIASVETGVQCLLIEYGISHGPFSDSQLTGLPYRPDFIPSSQRPDAAKWAVGSGYHPKGSFTPYSWTIPTEYLAGRRDLRASHRGSIMSIDPIGCVDIDDALSVVELGAGRVEIGVHIADVTALVQAGSPLDLEAEQRATSVYLVDRRLDMLPAVLSEDLCSLRGSTDRLCVSVIWTIDSSGSIESTWFGRTVIHNSYALSYEEAQDIFDSKGMKSASTLPKSQVGNWPQAQSLAQSDYRSIYDKVRLLYIHSRRLKSFRTSRGAVELSSLDLEFQLSKDKKNVQSIIQTEQHNEFHSVIEEWMVAANAAVAYHCWSHFPDSALLRRHPKPRESSLAPLLECAARLSVPMDASSNAALARSLQQAEVLLKQKFNQATNRNKSATQSNAAEWSIRVLKEVASRCMSEAQYFSTSLSQSVDMFDHYGLSVPFYSHYTSPIRRYADVVVHRTLLRGIEQDLMEKKTKSLVPMISNQSTSAFDTLEDLARHLNDRNRSARMAGKDSQMLFLAAYLANGLSWEQDNQLTSKFRVERVTALVTNIRDNGLKFVIPDLHLKGAVRLIDNDNHSLVVENQSAGSDAFDAPQIGQQAKISMHDSSALMMKLANGSACTFRLFDSIELLMTLRPSQQRYRIPEPIFRIFWPTNKSLATSTKSQNVHTHAVKSEVTRTPNNAIDLLAGGGLNVLQRVVQANERRLVAKHAHQVKREPQSQVLIVLNAVKAQAISRSLKECYTDNVMSHDDDHVVDNRPDQSIPRVRIATRIKFG